MLILGILVVGLFAGWVAQLVRYRGQRIDWPLALGTGFVGSFVGGTLLSVLFGDGFAIRPSGIIGSVIGALIVLLIVGAWARRRPAL